MNERILNLLSLCLQAREKGIDAFFDYAPHVQTIGIRIHLKGWKESIVVNDVMLLDYTDRRFYFDVNSEAEITEAEEYLKGLI